MSEDESASVSPFYSLFIRQLEQLETEYEPENENVPNQNIITSSKKDRIFQYLSQIAGQDDLKVNDYFKDLQWVNVNQPLSLDRDLAGMLVVVDFFTYCCINCLHMLPFLRQFEAQNDNKSSKAIALLGVHSPKFETEKSLDSVASAVLRYDIAHPVANDPHLKLWNHLNISCWPTVVILSPDAKLLFYLIGETAIQERLHLYLDASLDFYKQKLTGNRANLRINLLKDLQTSENLLYFPTKVAVSLSGNQIAIANSRKNSIIIASKEGLVSHIIGSNNPEIKGFTDGSLDSSSLFNSPQGVVFQSEEVLYVCDTENHAIRKIDLISARVETVAGNGRQNEKDKVGGKVGTEQGLNSPWDAVYDEESNRLYIAMAGCHQIWVMILSKEGDVVHGVQYPPFTCLCFAGDGSEEKRNNRFPLKAAFAQPSGVCLILGGENSQKLFIADSESSSIRVVDLGCGSGAVSTHVGGGLDPRDLFAFGDADGIGSKVRLQHPMGVCSSEQENRLFSDVIYIADTFNHKIKKVCLSSKQCTTVEVKEEKGVLLSEPNGLCFYSKEKLLIADTNNHRIVLLDLTTGILEELKLIQLSALKVIPDVTDSGRAKTENRKFIKVSKVLTLSDDGNSLQVELRFNSFTDGFKADSEAVQRIKITSSAESANNLLISPLLAEITNLALNGINFSVSCCAFVDKLLTLSIFCDLTLCNDALNCCKLLLLQVDVPVQLVNKQTTSNCGGDDNCGVCLESKQCIEIDA